MALYDKVISILSIPDKNTNDSIDINSTSQYDKWANGDGQYLLPLILIMIIAFCCICGIIQVIIFLIMLCVRYLTDADKEEECFKEEKNSGSSSRKELSKRQIIGSQAESTEGSSGNGTPRSRKSITSSPSV